MKIRNGFVSNSSSSSFVLFGVKTTPLEFFESSEFKELFEQEINSVQEQLNIQWNKIVNHPDFEKHKSIYEMCKTNKVSIPNETDKFFGYGFKGVFEPQKPNRKSVAQELIWDRKIKFPNGVSYIDADGVIYLGKNLATSSDDYLSDGNISINEMINYSEELKNLGFKTEDIKLYYGTYSS